MAEDQTPGTTASSPGAASPSTSAPGAAPTGASPSNPATAGAPTAAPTAAASSAPQRPAFVPEAHWDPTAGKIKDEAALAEHINKLIASDAAETSRKLSLPKPEDYKAELPANFQKPDGIDFTIKADDPLLAQARTWAHQRGLNQEAFSELLGMHAAAQINQEQVIKSAREAEIQKLGAAAPARVDAVSAFLKATIGDQAKPLLDSIWTADAVKSWETLMQKLTSQGAGSFSQAHRDVQETNGKIAGYDKMTFEQRRAAQDALLSRAR